MAALVWVQSVCVCVWESLLFNVFFAICRQRTTPTQDMHMTPHTPAKHTHTHKDSHTHRHPHKESPTHTYRHTYTCTVCTHTQTAPVYYWTFGSRPKRSGDKQTHIQTYIQRERERESAPKRVSSSRKQRLRMREREPVPPNPPHSQSGNYFTQLSLLIFCVFILNFCGSMCLANPKNNKNFEFTTACSAVCTVRKLQRTRSCSLALTNAHCYCPCLCRLFSMRMRDAARCFRSHSWLSRTAAAAALRCCRFQRSTAFYTWTCPALT